MRKNILWLALPVAAAGGAAAFLLIKKTSKPAGGKGSSASSPAKAPAVPAAAKEGSYSFISGFQDAATVEMKFTYDAEQFHYAVVEDEFLAESGDSHVGILRGPAFSAQFEYGSYYSGEDFEKHCRELAAKHRDIAAVSCGSLSGMKYRDGDNFCLVFPIPEDSHSYLLVTLVKAPDNDDALEALPDYPELRFLLGSASFVRS